MELETKTSSGAFELEKLSPIARAALLAVAFPVLAFILFLSASFVLLAWLPCVVYSYFHNTLSLSFSQTDATGVNDLAGGNNGEAKV